MEAIQQIVNDQVQSMIDSGAIQKSIEANIEKSINSAIESQFRSYGDITKQIEEGFKEGLKVDFKDMPFEVYNQQMFVAVQTKLGNLFAAEASGKFMAEMDNLLEAAPAEMSLKDLVEAIAKSWKTDEPWDADNLDESATVEIEESRYSSKSYTLKMWKQKESSGYSSRTNSPDLQLYIIDGAIRINHNHSYNPTCFSEHEALIFKLYSAGTKITGLESFDEDDCELTLKESEY